MYILSLLPFSKTSNTEDDVNWHLVIFNKWIDLGIKLPYKYYTDFYFNKCDNYFSFVCRWLKPNKEDGFYHKHCQAFWSANAFKRGFYIDDEWLYFDTRDLTFRDIQYYEEISDIYKTSFKLLEGEERIPVEVQVRGQAFKYAPDILKYDWLKELYCKIFKKENKQISIKFSTDIGPDRGTWKGGIIQLWHPFILNLMLSWVDFKNEELGRRLNGQKFI